MVSSSVKVDVDDDLLSEEHDTVIKMEIVRKKVVNVLIFIEILI